MQVAERGAAWGRGRHKPHGGIMRIRRAIIIPALLALGAAGSAVAGSAMSAAAGHAPAAQTQVVAAAATATHYHS